MENGCTGHCPTVSRCQDFVLVEVDRIRPLPVNQGAQFVDIWQRYGTQHEIEFAHIAVKRVDDKCIANGPEPVQCPGRPRCELLVVENIGLELKH